MLQVALGNGDGTFKPPIDTTVGGPGSVAAPFAAADFTGDGLPDVAIGNDREIHVYKGNGDGTFSAGPVTQIQYGAAILVAADLNGGGKPDLVLKVPPRGFVATTPQLAVVMNRGGGSFGPMTWYQSQNGFCGVAADFRHLGRADLVVAGDFYPNDGSGHFRAPRASAYPPFNSNVSARSLVAADFNNDGSLDAGVILGHTADVFDGNGRGDWGSYRQSTFNLPFETAIHVAVAADLNGDGKPDLALGIVGPGSDQGEAAIALGNGDGTFGPLAVVYGGHNVEAMVAADFNRDGHVDLAAGVAGGIAVLTGDGAGGFAITAFLKGAANTTSLVTADFNGDGIPDLATASDVYLGNGDGTFRHSFALPEPGELVVTADFNLDGFPDLVLSVAGNLVFWPGLGDGTFGLPLSIAPNVYPSSNVFLAADLNGDGIPDIVAAGTFQVTATTFFLGRGDGTFSVQEADSLPQASYNAPLISADFNQDGRADLLVVNGGQLPTLRNTTR